MPGPGVVLNGPPRGGRRGTSPRNTVRAFRGKEVVPVARHGRGRPTGARGSAVGARGGVQEPDRPKGARLTSSRPRPPPRPPGADRGESGPPGRSATPAESSATAG